MLRKCSRCGKRFSEEDLFYLGYKDDNNKPVYACEGCLFSFEQDSFFNRFTVLPASPVPAGISL